jgi:hypothetical protein
MKISLSRVTKRGSKVWMVSWRPPNGKRQRRFFRAKAHADACQQDLAAQQDSAGTVWLGLSGEQRNDVAGLVAQGAREGFTLREAVEFYLRHRSSGEISSTLGEAYNRFIAEKQAMRLAPKTLAALRSTVGRFVSGREAAGLGSIRRDDLQTWLQRPDWSPRTFNSYLTSLATFFRWAVAADLLSKSPAASLRKISFRQMPDIDEAPAVLSVAQCRSLLEATLNKDPGLAPYVAVCLFGGLRPEREAGGLMWGDVEADFISVRGLHAKDRQRRRVAIHTTLRAWLDLGGDLPPKNLRWRFETVREAAGLIRREKRPGKRDEIKPTGWVQDCLRHTFASNYLPEFGVENTVEALGHGDYAMLFRHYRNLVSVGQAHEFWGLTPQRVIEGRHVAAEGNGHLADVQKEATDLESKLDSPALPQEAKPALCG